MPTELSELFDEFADQADISSGRRSNPDQSAIRESFAAWLVHQGISPTKFTEEQWYAFAAERGVSPEHMAAFLEGLGEWWTD